MSTQTFQKGDRVIIGPEADASFRSGSVTAHRAQHAIVYNGLPDEDGDVQVVPDGLDDDDYVFVLPEHLTLETPAHVDPLFTLDTIRRALTDLGYFVASPGEDGDPAGDTDWDHILTYALGLAERARLEDAR